MRARGAWDPGKSCWREVMRNVREIQRTGVGSVVEVRIDRESFEAILRSHKHRLDVPALYYQPRKSDAIARFDLFPDDSL